VTEPAEGSGMRAPVALLYRILGVAALGLAILGVILPGLPATPFLLLAVWAFGRGAPAWAERIRRHPRLGPYLQNWSERRVVPLRAKAAAVLSMVASFAILWWSGAGPLLLAWVAVVCSAVSGYLLTRPSA
jgi:uncharacterized protein